MRQITVNGEARALADNLDVATLVQQVTGLGTLKGVAVAVNGDVVRRSTWCDTQLRDGDDVELLQAAAGG